MTTTIAEVWGDRLAAQQERGGALFVIPAAVASQWAFLELERLPLDLRLLDLTQSASLLAAGLDAATLYVPDLAIPQGWAERIAGHPAKFDGIAFRSRHTGEKALVLWDQPGGKRAVESRLRFEPSGEFLESDEAYLLAGYLRLRLAFVR